MEVIDLNNLDNDTSNYWDIAYINNWLCFTFANSPHSAGSATLEFWAYTDGQENNIAFTGQHPCKPGSGTWESYQNKIGFIVTTNGSYDNGGFSTKVTSKTAPNINEALPLVTLSDKANDKKVFGVISDVEDGNRVRTVQHGKITSVLSGDAFQAKGDERLWINSIGEGAIMVSNYNGNLENGDYITTSPIEGLGMKQDDDLLHNYTVAKITQDCDFSSGTTTIVHNGQEYKYKLVGCTYHCG